MTESRHPGFGRRPIGAWSFFTPEKDADGPGPAAEDPSLARAPEALFEAALQANAAAIALAGSWTELMHSAFWGSFAVILAPHAPSDAGAGAHVDASPSPAPDRGGRREPGTAPAPPCSADAFDTPPPAAAAPPSFAPGP